MARVRSEVNAAKQPDSPSRNGSYTERCSTFEEMTNQEKIANYFSLFHDGTIKGYSIDKHDLILVIECKFLAEIINPNFTKFYIKLVLIESIEFETCPRDLKSSARTLYEINEIFREPWEILYSRPIVDNSVSVECANLKPSSEYLEGKLKIKCKDILIEDESKKELSERKLEWLHEQYWGSI